MSAIFPRWTNVLGLASAVGVLGGLTAVVGGFWYYATPKFFRVGFEPVQPGGGFNHQIHAGKLGMDCRYCHTKVEVSAEANIPNVATCYGCHAPGRLKLLAESEAHRTKTEFVREAYTKNESIPWKRVHKVPDYVRNFPHNAHIRAGVSCYSCHGQITGMPVVYEAEPLSMSWCLDCHRQAAPNLVPRDKVTDLYWVEQHMKDAAAVSQRSADGEKIIESLRLNPPQNCGACHY